MPPPMTPAPSTPTRSTGRGSASGAAFLAPSIRKNTWMRLLQTSETARRPAVAASRASAWSTGSDNVLDSTSSAASGAG